jgi:hypothetical protein
MQELKIYQILVKNAKLAATKLDENSLSITKLIDETKKKQNEILKLKEVNQETLRMVVQL